MLAGLEFMCKIQWVRPSVAPYAAVLDGWTGVDQNTFSCTAVALNRMFVYDHASPSSTHAFHVTGHRWRCLCMCVCASRHKCLFMHHHVIYHFSGLGASSFQLHFSPSLKLTSHLHGWVAGDGTIRTVVGSGVDVSSLHVVAPAAKWCGSCAGPQGAWSHVQGTRGSSVYLWSHWNRDNCVCSPGGWSSFWTDAALPLILFLPP